MRETQVQSLGWEDPLEKEMATHSSTLAWKSHGWRSLVGYSPWGCKELDMTEQLHFASIIDLRHTLLIANPVFIHFLPIFLNNQTLNLSKVCASSFPDSQ